MQSGRLHALLQLPAHAWSVAWPVSFLAAMQKPCSYTVARSTAGPCFQTNARRDCSAFDKEHHTVAPQSRIRACCAASACRLGGAAFTAPPLVAAKYLPHAAAPPPPLLLPPDARRCTAAAAEPSPRLALMNANSPGASGLAQSTAFCASRAASRAPRAASAPRLSRAKE